jgi:hypothetical protein
MLHLHFARKLLQAHVSQLVAAPKLKTAPHIGFYHFTGSNSENILREEVIYSLQKLKLV